MLDSYYRDPYQKIFVKPIIQFAICKNIHPTFFTFLSLFFGLTSFFLLLLGMGKMAAFSLLLSGYLDTVDGSLARKYNKITNQGAVLDIVFDRSVEFMVILGLYWVDPEPRAFLCLTMLGSAYLCVTSFLVVGIFTQNDSAKSFHYSPGLVERGEAFCFFLLMILFPSSFTLLAAFFSFGMLLTACIRVLEFCKNQAQEKRML